MIKQVDSYEASVGLLGERLHLLDFNQTEYLKNSAKGIMSVEILSKSVKNLGASFNFAAIGAKALNMALHFAIGAGVAGVIQLISAGINHFYTTQAQLEEALRDSAQQYTNTQSEIENLNTSLQSNRDRIKEIKEQGTITYVEQAELDKLEQANSLLEAELSLLERRVEVDRRQLALNAVKASNFQGLAYNDDFGVKEELARYREQISERGHLNIDYLLGDSNTKVNYTIAAYEELLDRQGDITEGTKEWADALDIITQTEQKLIDQLSEVTNRIGDIKDEYDLIKQSQSEGMSLSTDDLAIVDTYEKLIEFSDLIQKTIDPSNWNALKIEEIFDTEGIEYTKEQFIELARVASLEELDLIIYGELKKAIQDCDLVLADGKTNLEAFKEELIALSDVEFENPLDSIFEISEGMEDTLDVFDRMSEKLTYLADLQEALGDSFVLSADQARYFADVYPELLAMGQVTADGLIAFNEATVSDFIEGKRVSAEADAEVRVAELENAKAVLIGLRQKAEAELEIAHQVKNGELTLEQGLIEAQSAGRRALTQYLIDLGVDEIEANKIAAEVQAGNMEEYARVVAGVSNNNAENLSGAIAAAAASTKQNAISMVDSLDSVGIQARNVAKQILHMGSGGETYGGKVGVGGAPGSGSRFTAQSQQGAFNGNTGAPITAQFADVDSWISALELDISKYTQAIGAIDSQINLIQSNLGTNLSSHSSGKYTPKPPSSSGGNKTPSQSQNKQVNEKQFSKTYDWLSVALDKLEDGYKKLKHVTDNVYASWSDRNKSLSAELTNLADQLSLQSVAYSSYMAQANSVGLSDHYKNLVQSGAISIETVTDENLAKKIDEYTKWYDLAQSTLDNIQSLEQQMAEIATRQFNQIISEFENKLSDVEFKSDYLLKSMGLAEAKGLIASASYYESLINLERDTIKLLEEERHALALSLEKSVSDGLITEYTEAWYDLKNQINDVDLALIDANTSLQEFINSMRKVEWEMFDYLQSTISQITTESNFLINLLGSKDLYDKSGNRTAEGDAILALRGINYNTYMQQADEYAKSIRELDEEFKNDSLNLDYLARRQELVELQQNSILAAESEKQALFDLIKNGYEAQLDALKDLIQARKDLLQAEKDLFDFEKKIADKTKQISQIEKQLSAYAGDTSEESKKTIQELKVALENAQDDLRQTEYERYLADQKALLDELYDEYQLWINERLDNLDLLLTEIIDNINQNASSVEETIKEAADSVGYELSESMNTIFDTSMNEYLGENSAVVGIISEYNKNFTDTMTTLQQSINDIKANLDEMANLAQLEAEKAKQEAEDKVSGSSSSSGGSSSGSSSGGGQSGGSASNGNNDLLSIFVHKKDTYPKHLLKRTTSIVDALKYFDYDSSFNQRKNYFSRLGGSGNYTGSASQNSWLLSRFRGIKGYSTGGVVGGLESIIRGNGDDTLTVNTLKKGEAILPTHMVPQWFKLIDNLDTINSLVDSMGSSTKIDNINFSIVLPNVDDYHDFKAKLLSDDGFKGAVLTNVGASLSGSNSLNNSFFK